MYCRRRELGGQHAFYIAPATKKNHCTPQLCSEISYSSSFFETRISSSPQQKQPWFWNCRREPVLFLQQKSHRFRRNYFSRHRKNMIFQLSPDRRLTPEGLGVGAPVHELQETMNRAPDTLFPQRSRNFPATQLGSSHGATWCHIPQAYSAIE